MKNGLISSVAFAIVTILVAYFVCNMFIGPVETVSFPAIDSSTSTSLEEPDPEVFNYKSLNPTVEVYVGNCNSYGANGECLDEGSN